MNLGLIMEQEEKRELHRIRCSFEENNVGDDMEGGIDAILPRMGIG